MGCARRGADVVEQIWVYGNSYESFLVAVVVPNKRELTSWAKEQGGLPSDFAELCATPQVSAASPWQPASGGQAAPFRRGDHCVVVSVSRSGAGA